MSDPDQMATSPDQDEVPDDQDGEQATAQAHHDGHDHVSETWTGDPGGRALELDIGSGTDVAVFGRSSSSNARALKGYAPATSGNTIGVEGKAASPDGIALLGNATATDGTAKGLEGRSAAKFGTGVVGYAKHDSGEAKGVRGLAESPSGRGGEFTNTASSGDAFGVTAESQSSAGTAVRGHATATAGTTYGVRGEVDSPDGYGLYTPDDAYVGGVIGTDPVVVGSGASADSTATVVGANSTAPPASVVIGDGIDASGNDYSTVIGQASTSGGDSEVLIGHNIDGAKGAVSIGRNISNKPETVTIGLNPSAANRNSVCIGSHVNENAAGTNSGWSGIRVAVGSRAAAAERGTAMGPGAGEWGTPGKYAVNIGNQTSTAADYSIALGDQSEIGTDGSGVPMVKSGASGAVAIGTSVEVATSQVARIGTSGASNPSPRQLVWQGAEQLPDADYRTEEVTLFMDEANGQFVIKGKDSSGTIRTATLSW
jgi:hypothetical protein